MALNLQPVTQKQFLVSLGSLSANFTKCSSPAIQREEAEYNDGLTGQTRSVVGFTKLEKVTLSKPYDPAKDAPLLDWYQDTFKTNERFQVTIQVVKPDQEGSPVSGAKTLTLTECQLQSFKHPDIDRMGSGVAMLEIVIIPESMSMG